MDMIISSSQYAFIKGRHLVDGVLVINEGKFYITREKSREIIPKLKLVWCQTNKKFHLSIEAVSKIRNYTK